jgi:hypothetical protein
VRISKVAMVDDEWKSERAMRTQKIPFSVANDA